MNTRDGWEVVERAKCELREAQGVLHAHVDGLGIAETAVRLAISAERVRWLRCVLRLDVSLEPLRSRLARADKRNDTREVAP